MSFWSTLLGIGQRIAGGRPSAPAMGAPTLGGTRPGYAGVLTEGSAPPAATPGASGTDSPSWLADIGKFITQNPELVTGLAGTAANVYGGIQAGKAKDRELNIIEEENKRRAALDEKRRRDNQIFALMQAMQGFR